MAETQQNPLTDLVRQTRERLDQELRGQAEHLEKLEQSLQELRNRQRELEAVIQQQLEMLAAFELPAPPPPSGSDVPLEKLLGSVRDLITATLPEQVFDVLAEEAEQTGVQAAVFDVRGKAAWGSSARGFGAQLSERVLRSLVVSLNQDNPFRQVYETGGHVDASVELLKRNRNILDKLKPTAGEPILLLPIRSAGSVSAIFYAHPGAKGKPLPVEALKILTEFAGAQLDRLMALSGGVPAEAVVEEAVEAEPAVVAEPEAAPVEAVEPEPVVEPASTEPAAHVVSVEVAKAPPGEAASVVESAPVVEAAPLPPPPSPPPPVVEETPMAAQPAVVPAPAPAAVGFDVSQLSEADQKVHKDAKRFAKLLISEIELYNKPKVAEGRKNKDLYERLKSDIERSRQTYEKRFGKMVAKQVDYFHEELVRTLAGNDSSLLGSSYPGPSV